MYGYYHYTYVYIHAHIHSYIHTYINSLIHLFIQTFVWHPFVLLYLLCCSKSGALLNVGDISVLVKVAPPAQASANALPSHLGACSIFHTWVTLIESNWLHILNRIPKSPQMFQTNSCCVCTPDGLWFIVWAEEKFILMWPKQRSADSPERRRRIKPHIPTGPLPKWESRRGGKAFGLWLIWSSHNQ